jgi:hypothetical protein
MAVMYAKSQKKPFFKMCVLGYGVFAGCVIGLDITRSQMVPVIFSHTLLIMRISNRVDKNLSCVP